MFKLKPLFISAMLPLLCLSETHATTISTNDLIISQDVKHDLSRPLRNIATNKSTAIKSPLIIAKNKLLKSPSLIELYGFPGIGIGLGSYTVSTIKPKPMASVGMKQFVEWANNDIAVFDKRTGNLSPGFPKRGNALWSGFGGPCETTNLGIATVKYDQLAKRWVMTQHAYKDNSGPFYICLAISNSEDATDAYHRYAFPLDSKTDFARFSLWHDAYYMTLHSTGPAYNGELACALDRNKILSGNSASMQCKRLSPEQRSLVIPADLDGTNLPKTGTPGLLMGLLPPQHLYLTQFKVDFNNASNTQIKTAKILVDWFDNACNNVPNGGGCAIQPNTTNRLAVYSNRLMNRLAYRQFDDYGAMVATHTVTGPEPEKTPAIRWYELHVSSNNQFVPTVYQQATHAPDSKNRFIGSIAMDKMANIAVGYTVTSELVSPSIELGVHHVTDPLNVMTIQPMVTGMGSQVNSKTDWGSFAAMSQDPEDNCTFWHTGEYLKKTGSYNWSTQVIHFKLDNCA